MSDTAILTALSLATIYAWIAIPFLTRATRAGMLARTGTGDPVLDVLSWPARRILGDP